MEFFRLCGGGLSASADCLCCKVGRDSRKAAQGVQPLVRSNATQNSPDIQVSGLFASQSAHTGVSLYKSAPFGFAVRSAVINPIEESHNLSAGAIRVGTECSGAGPAGNPLRHSPVHSVRIVGVCRHIGKNIDRGRSGRFLGTPQEGDDVRASTLGIGTKGGVAGALGTASPTAMILLAFPLSFPSIPTPTPSARRSRRRQSPRTL